MTSFRLNGREVSVQTPDDAPLLWAIRDEAGLTGTKFGCGIGACGACTVLVDGKPTRSCVTPLGNVQSRPVQTLEALRDQPVWATVVEAFARMRAFQCGFCTPGFVLMTRQLLARSSDPGEDEIRHYLSGNLCRCAAYPEIIRAVQLAARIRRGAP